MGWVKRGRFSYVGRVGWFLAKFAPSRWHEIGTLSLNRLTGEVT